jgi:hypothetical protein
VIVNSGAGNRHLVGILAAAVLAGMTADDAAGSRSLLVSDEGHLRYIRSSGDELVDEGRASGTMPGSVVVRFTYDGNPTVYSRFTIQTRWGVIRGSASGRLSDPNSTSPSFRGALSLGGGSGRYAHARGSGELFGVFYRRDYGLVVQARGRLGY